jgi:ferredoxin
MNVNFRNQTIKANETETILEALERYEIKSFSMCREGYCATCKIILEKGEVEYIDTPIAILESNEILPCICRPKTDIIIRE